MEADDAITASWVLWLTVPIYLGQLAVMGWAIPAGAPALLPPGFVGCVPSPKPGTGIRLSSIYIAALVFDATIFALTLGRAIYYRLSGSLIPLITLVIRDGTLYFAVIFAVNLANVFLLSPDLSAINAPFASMITATLVARLMLNLRQAASVPVHSKASTGASITFGSGAARSGRNVSSFHAATTPGQTTTFLGRMGADEFAVPLPDTIFKTSEGTTSVSEASSDWTDNVQEAYQMT
ncbi:hypothetical protein PM082_018760 [Marasmius tenuissimus]|nr:hypothetical protein PM082_018760 [Marasmius tenuissimus]